MGKIIFFIDEEEGHYLPTISFASSLSMRGHSIIYAGIRDCEDTIIENGFQYYVLAEDLYPLGYKKVKQDNNTQGASIGRLHFFERLHTEVRRMIYKVDPDVVVVSTYLSLDALLLVRALQVRVIMFTPYLLPDSFPRVECWKTITTIFLNRKGEQITKLFHRYKLQASSPQEINDIALILDKFPEIVACPDDFDLPYNSQRNNRFFIGPQIRNTIGSWELEIPKEKKIIYVSMGSQLARVKEKCAILYSTLFEVIDDSDMSDFHLVLSGGGVLDLCPVGEKNNVTIMGWAPQLEILKRASLMINHGGLGTIKECIANEVPMIVIPDKYDQPSNAERVAYHLLGTYIAFGQITKSAIKQSILNLVSNNDIKLNLRRMKEKFEERDRLLIGELLVENEIIKSKGRRGKPLYKLWRFINMLKHGQVR